MTTINTTDARQLQTTLAAIPGVTATLDGPDAFGSVTIRAAYDAQSVDNRPGLYETPGLDEAHQAFTEAGYEPKHNGHQKKLTLTAELTDC